MPEDQLSLAIGKRGQNARLAARLTGWHIDILTEDEAKREREAERAEMQRLPEIIEGLDPSTVETLLLSGFSSLHAIAKKGVEALLSVKGMDDVKAHALHEYTVGRVKELDEEKSRRIIEERRRAREAAAEALAEEQRAAEAAAAEAEVAEKEAASEQEQEAEAGAVEEDAASEQEQVAQSETAEEEAASEQGSEDPAGARRPDEADEADEAGSTEGAPAG